MAITEALRLLITADSSGAVKSIQDVGRTSERELSRSEKSLDRWGNRLTTMGAGMIAFGAVAAAGLHQAAQAAGELEQQVGATEAIFGGASGTIDEFARGAADSLGLSEVAAREATTRIGGALKRMGFEADEAAAKAIELTEVGADLAAQYGGTTAEAVEALGAAFRGEADPAERFNLDLRISAQNAKAVELGLASSTSAVSDHARAQALLALVTEQSADALGANAREADTLQGRQQRLAASFENMKAEIGAGVVPAMEKVLSVAKGGIGAFSGLNNATGGAVGKLATVATVASLGVGGLSLLVGQAIKMRQTFSDAVSGIQSLSGKLGGLKMAAGLAAGVAGIAGVGIALDQMEQSRRAAKVDELTRQFLATGEAAELVNGLMDESMGGVKEFAAALGTLAESDREAAMQLIDAAEAAGLHDDAVEALRNRVEEYGQAEERAGIDIEGATGAVEGQTGAMEDAAGATDEATSALQDYSDSMKALTDPVFAAMDAVTGLRDAQVAVADAERGVLEAQAELDEAIRNHGRNSSEAAEATLGLEEAQRNLEDAQWATVTSAAEADSALAGLKDAVESGDVSMADFQRTLRQWVAQGFLTEQQAAQAAMEVAGLGTQADKTDRKRILIPVGLSGWASAMAALAGLDLKIRQLDGSTITVNANVRATSTGRIGGVPVFHEGGVVPGPRGQEVAAILQAGERVISLQDQDKWGRSWAGGGMAMQQAPVTSIAFHITGDGRLGRDVMEAVRRGEAILTVDGKRVRAA